MIIEKVILNTTVKAGKTVWEKDTILDAPLPEDILLEISNNTGTVKILKQGQNVELVKNISVLVQKEKLKDSTTTTTVEAKKEKPKLKLKPKVKLIKRKK